MKKRLLISWIASGLCLVLGAGCNKTTTEPTAEEVKVSFAHTQCADPWGFTKTDQELRDAAYAYVKAKGATPFPLTVSNTGLTAVCAACTCPTGTVLTGTARRADLPTLEAIGFKPQ